MNKLRPTENVPAPYCEDCARAVSGYELCVCEACWRKTHSARGALYRQCEVCGRDFPRDNGETAEEFRQRRTCGPACEWSPMRNR